MARAMTAIAVVLLSACLSLAAAGPSLTSLLEVLNLSGYAEGTSPPGFGGQTTDGRRLSRAGLRGRVVLLTFWATWCLPCREELPALEQLHRGFSAEGLTVLGVNVREEEPAIRRYAQELGLTFPLVLDPEGKTQVSYGVVGLPTSFLIGRDGYAVARAIGPREWGSAPAGALIRALLAEPSARR